MRMAGNRVTAVALAAALALSTGCGGGGGAEAFNVESLQDCGLAGILAMLSSIERLGEVLDEIEGTDSPRVTITPTGNANEFDFTLTLDLNLDGATETLIGGRLAFANDPTDGIEIGDTAVLNLNQPSSTQVSAVSGMLNMTFTAGGVSLVGNAAINGILGCNVNASFPDSDPLLINFNEPDIEFQRLAVDFANFLSLSGTAQMIISASGNTLTSTVMFSNSSQNISFTQSTLNNSELNDSNVDAPLDQTEFEALQRCVFQQLLAINLVGGAIENVLDAVSDGLTGMTADGDPFTFTNVSGNTYDITLMSTDLSVQATITARAAFDSDPTVPAFTGTADVSSWSLQIRILNGQLAGINPEDFFRSDVDGTSTGPMRVTYADSSPTTVSGRGRFTRLDGTCTADVEVPVTNPLVLDEDVVDPAPGRLEVDLTLDGVPFAATIIFDGQTILGEQLITGASYDGIPIPGNLLASLLIIPLD